MNENQSLTEIADGDWQVIFALCCAMLGFLAYHFTTEKKGSEEKAPPATKADNTALILLQRMKGVLFLGILPVLACFTFEKFSLSSLGLGFQNLGKSLFWLAAFALPIFLVNLFSTKRPANLAMYPQIRARQWTPRLLMLSAAGWLLYLLAYEILFRGILFLPVAGVLGLPVATAINVALYALAHLPKGRAETLAAIPFGAVLCYLTYLTGTIWAAFFLHAMLALSNEWLSIYHHKNMKFVKSRKS